MKNSNNKKSVFNKTYLSVGLLGNSLKLNIIYTKNTTIELNILDNELELLLPNSYKKLDHVPFINAAIKKLYNKVADMELEDDMETIRHILGFAPEDYKIERLNNSYYKCIGKKLIINPDIVQYNREVIITTLIQAFCKIKYKPSSVECKDAIHHALLKYDSYKISQFNINLKVS